MLFTLAIIHENFYYLHKNVILKPILIPLEVIFIIRVTQNSQTFNPSHTFTAPLLHSVFVVLK